MSAVSLAGLLPEFGKLTPAVAAQWVAAAVAQAGVLRAYDGWLYPIDPARQPAAERLHEAWRAWEDDAQALLHEADALAAVGNDIPALGALRELIAHARALLRLTPALILHRYQQVQ